jgi:hypothetical protein
VAAVFAAAVFVLQAAMAQDVQLADPPASEQERGAPLVAVAQDAPPVRGVALVAHSAELPDGRRGVL